MTKEKKEVTKKATKEKKATKATKKKKVIIGTKEVAKMLGMTPKALRRHLRKMEAYNDKKYTFYKWEKGSKEVKAVVEYVKKATGK